MQLQLAKLHVCTYTKQAAGTFYQRVIRGEGDVTRFNELDNLVFLAFVAQLQVLAIKVEGSIGVIVQRHIHLVAHLTRDVDIDFLVEVNGLGLAITLRQRGIVYILEIGTQLEFGSTLRLDAHTAGTKDFLGRPKVEVHIGKVKLFLALIGHILSILSAEEALSLPALAPLTILFRRHQHGRIQIRLANLCS